jgi:hypothetical protein
MPYLDLEAGFVTTSAVANTFTALAPAAGDTFTVRSLDPSQNARLLGFGAVQADIGIARIRSPFLHDDVNALRFSTQAADPSSVIDQYGLQSLRAQDPLLFEVTNETAAAELCSGWFLNYYGSLAGGPSIFITAAELRARAIEQSAVTVPVTAIVGATAYGTNAILNGTGVLKADQVYAILGYDLDVACTAVAILGPDTGNFKAGGPGILSPRQFTRNWFGKLSEDSGLPTIPCFNAQNASGTLVYVIANTAVAPNVTLNLVRLKK